MDTASGLELDYLLGAGLEPTLEYLHQQGRREIAEAFFGRVESRLLRPAFSIFHFLSTINIFF